MARQISLEDKEWIEVTDSKKEVMGGFWWNPSDLDIVKRCDEVIKRFGAFKVPEEMDEAAMMAMSEEVKGNFDFLLSSPGASDALFSSCNPLSPCADGRLWCEYVLDVLIDFIQAELKVRIKKSSERVRKYTDKYKR